MWIGVLWAGLRIAMWITHVGSKFRYGLLEKSVIKLNWARKQLINIAKAKLELLGINLAIIALRTGTFSEIGYAEASKTVA